MLLAFILGAVSGAAVALLYAPAPAARRATISARGPARGATGPPTRPSEAATCVNQGRETLTNALERGREAYQQARTRETP